MYNLTEASLKMNLIMENNDLEQDSIEISSTLISEYLSEMLNLCIEMRIIRLRDQLAERQRLYALDLYELEDGEILE